MSMQQQKFGSRGLSVVLVFYSKDCYFDAPQSMSQGHLPIIDLLTISNEIEIKFVHEQKSFIILTHHKSHFISSQIDVYHGLKQTQLILQTNSSENSSLLHQDHDWCLQSPCEIKSLPRMQFQCLPPQQGPDFPEGEACSQHGLILTK